MTAVYIHFPDRNFLVGRSIPTLKLFAVGPGTFRKKIKFTFVYTKSFFHTHIFSLITLTASGNQMLDHSVPKSVRRQVLNVK